MWMTGHKNVCDAHDSPGLSIVGVNTPAKALFAINYATRVRNTCGEGAVSGDHTSSICMAGTISLLSAGTGTSSKRDHASSLRKDFLRTAVEQGPC